MTRNLFPGPDMHALRARPPEEEKAYGLICANQNSTFLALLTQTAGRLGNVFLCHCKVLPVFC